MKNLQSNNTSLIFKLFQSMAMFLLEMNKSGSVNVQMIQKLRGKYKVLQTIGSGEQNRI